MKYDYILKLFTSRDVLFLCMLNVLAILPVSITPILIADIIDILLQSPLNKNRIYIELLFAILLVLFVFPARYFYRRILYNFRRKRKYALMHDLHCKILICPHQKTIDIERGAYMAFFNSDITNIVEMMTVTIENFPLIFLSFFFALGITGYVFPCFLLFYLLSSK